MIDFSKPIISAINGLAVGAGAVVAIMADRSIASEKASFGDGHSKMGVAAGDHVALDHGNEQGKAVSFIGRYAPSRAGGQVRILF